MSFNEQEWLSRYATMGSTAESAFLAANPHAHRLGIDRPDFSVTKLSNFFRQAPDFLLPQGAYEVMGVSSRAKRPSLKLKLEKLEMLKMWNYFGDVYLWVWDSSKKQSTCEHIKVWEQSCNEHGEVRKFEDNNKPYWDLLIEKFPGKHEETR